MADIALLPAMSAGKDGSMHPFFAGPHAGACEARSAYLDPPSADSRDLPSVTTSEPTMPVVASEMKAFDQLDGTQDPAVSSRPRPRKPRTSKASNDGKTQQTLNGLVKPKAENSHSDIFQEAAAGAAEDVTPLNKRRKLSHEGFVDKQPATASHDNGGAMDVSATFVNSQSHPDQSETSLADAETPQTPPKKVLRLSAHGKLLSPTSMPINCDHQPKKGRGRPRKAKKDVVKSLMVKLSYAKSSVPDVFARMGRILAGTERVMVHLPTESLKPKLRTPRKSTKPPHPFFDKTKPEPGPPKAESPRKTLSATTPGKLRMQAFGDRTVEIRAESTYMVGSDLLKDRLMIRHPGAREAPFPSRDQAHVRWLDESRSHMTVDARTLALPARKRKQARLPFPESESILTHVSAQLRVTEDERLRPDGFLEPSRELTVPQRLLLSGVDITQRVLHHVSLGSAVSADGTLLPTPAIHPAIRNLYARIPEHMTAYDHSKGEPFGWTQKYAPTTALDVLQPEQEMAILRSWLKSLEVNAVEGVASGKTATSNTTIKPPKKRRKKNAEMDDFLVDDAEDLHVMEEINLDTAEHLFVDDGGKLRKSVVQSSELNAKLSNAMLLSGPSGCGKTAAAYAVAKELGFKVFEISPSERRSGKDVLDKVGNMTENHLVKHHGTDAAPTMTKPPEESSLHDEAFQRDLESGRQGKMNTFFKPQARTKKEATTKKAAVSGLIGSKAIKDIQEALRKPAKDQQQSLILLEEVDIMFKDDKDFWPTVLKLIAGSKRPFLMTCNDEALVPLALINFHAILRFTPPPVALATDYLTLMAAAEGHLLAHDDIASLIRFHEHDLRASINELDFWCQMSVGDPRAGLTWIFQRWPPGSDLDEKGRKLRVVSQGTYERHMSLMPSGGFTPEIALKWVWAEFDVQPMVALGWHEMLNHELSSTEEAQASTIQQLKTLSSFADTVSAMDLICSSEVAETHLCDPTRRPLTDKQRNHYIEGRQLLQTDEPCSFSDISRDIATTLAVGAVGSVKVLFPSFTSTADGIFSNMFARKASELSFKPLHRRDFSCFDDIAVASDSNLLSHTSMLQSIFDGPLKPIATDIAPYVRSIVQYDQSLAEQRERLDLLTSGSQGSKGGRKTRAARSALEGSQRSTTRRETWFTEDLNIQAVLATGGVQWPRTVCTSYDQVSYDAGSESGEMQVHE